MSSDSTTQNYTEILADIARACQDADRLPKEVELICVTKTVETERITPILGAGQRKFGENRVQEALQKWPKLRERYDGIELSLIGGLQSNKAREAVAAFDVIQSLDRPKLALALAEEMSRQSRNISLFIQVNIGEEPQKGGVAPDQADAFIRQCREDLGLSIDGLMCIPPQNQLAAPYFARLKQIAARNHVAKLSMGMSSDYREAIMLGAHCVRIGSAIFGERESVSQ